MGLFSKKEEKKPEVLRTPEGMTTTEMLVEMGVPTSGIIHTNSNPANLAMALSIYKPYKKLEQENKLLWDDVAELQDFKNKVEKVLKL